MSRRKKTPPTSSTTPQPSPVTNPTNQVNEAACVRDPYSAHGREATRYAQRVVTGEIVACVEVRQACQRHLDDIERSKTADFEYYFDLRAAGRICYWLEQMPHVEGEWAKPILRNGKMVVRTITLEPWQKFVYGSIYGWLRKADGIRRFTKAYISVPRKNAKTTALAGIGHFGLLADGESGAQVYNGATKLEQAMMLFDPAKAMVAKRPEFFAKFGVVQRGEKRLWVPKSNSRWRPLSKTPGDGGGASLFIHDEFHEAKTARLAETMEDGQGARSQPLAIYITTAGHNIEGPCYSYELQIKRLLRGDIQRDRTFGIIYSIDLVKYNDPFGVEREPDDWTTVEAGMKANPNWGVSVMADHYLAQLEEAKQDPSKQTTFKTKRLNIWCNARDGYYNMHEWAACADPTLSLEEFLEFDCCIGLDLASKLDLCAMVLVFCRQLPGVEPTTGEACVEDHYYIFCRSYLPESQAKKQGSADWKTWEKEGFLTVTGGNITDYSFILRDLLKDAAAFNVREVEFDQREAGFLLQQFEQQEGTVPLFEVKQNTEVLNEPMKWLKSLVTSKRIHHNGDKLLSWAISNVVTKPDANENVFPRKAADDLKIDPHSALLTAMTRVRQVLSEPAVEDDCETQVW